MRNSFLCSGLIFLYLACCNSFATGTEPGDDKKVEASCERGLRFLLTSQQTNGSWADNTGTSNAAITSLAILSFISAGHSPSKEPYGEAIEKGILWILQVQQENGVIAYGRVVGYQGYYHSISTWMLAEVVGKVEKKLAARIRPKLEKAIDVMLKSQCSKGLARGGWRYYVRDYDSDLSITGWYVLALHAARSAGCKVPSNTLEAARDYILRCQDPTTGAFCYQPSSRKSVGCTAAGIVGLALLHPDGPHVRENLKAGSYLINNQARSGDLHFVDAAYKGSIASFQLGGDSEKAYQGKTYMVLLENQKEKGNWEIKVNNSYGANCVTSMAVLALTVGKQNLSVHKRVEKETQK